jgi:hypothetical protein
MRYLTKEGEDMMDFNTQIPSGVAIKGVEYPYTKFRDLSEIEQAEARMLTLRSASLLKRISELSDEEGNELDTAFKRLVDLFLQRVPTEIRERLSNANRIRVLEPVWQRSMADAGLLFN